MVQFRISTLAEITRHNPYSFSDYLGRDSCSQINGMGDDGPKLKTFDALERRDIVEIGVSLAKYLHSKKIPNVVLPDRSARLSYLALLHAWNYLYHDEKRPDIYFVNPKGLDTEDRRRKTIDREFRKMQSELVRHSKQPVLIFDTCVHSGETFERVSRALEAADFTDIRFGIAQPSEADSSVKIDFVAIKHDLARGCYLLDSSDAFDQYNLVTKESGKVVSTPEESTTFWGSESKERRRSVLVREEYSDIFRAVGMLR